MIEERTRDWQTRGIFSSRSQTLESFQLLGALIGGNYGKEFPVGDFLFDFF